MFCCVWMSSGPLPEAGALYVGLALADSPLSIFRDVNFDSCTMCVCNLNIDGSDVGSVLPLRGGSAGVDDGIRCTCAFRSVAFSTICHAFASKYLPIYQFIVSLT